MQIKRFLIIVVVGLLCGCQSQNFLTEVQIVETGTPTFLPATPTASKVPEEWMLWNTSAHSHTYNANGSSNTYCAECHSPLNWNPAIEKNTASTVSIATWQDIGCQVCHATKGEVVSSSIAWWDQSTSQYEPVSSSTELCEQCHRDTGEFHYQINLVSVHSSFQCINCHDPHSTTASCSNSGCHQNIRPESSIPPATPSGGVHPNNAAFCGGANCHPAATQAALSNYSIHGATHASVSCVACHDASGMDVGPSKELGIWITFQTAEVDGVKTQTPYRSHDIQTKVDCNRCHFAGNPWNLSSVTGNEFGP